MRAGVVISGGRSTRFGDADKAVADLAGVPMVRRVADRLVPAVDLLVVNCRADQREELAAALSGYEHPVRFAIDPEPDEGPMAGIRTGLREVCEAQRASNTRAGRNDPRDEETDAEYAFVAACDMPFLDADLVDYLFERAAGREADEQDAGADGQNADADERDVDEQIPSKSPTASHDAAVPRPTEWFETTHAVYRAEPMADACDEALARGEHKIIEPLFDLDYVVVEGEELSDFDSASFENVNTREEFEAAEERLREAQSQN